MSKLEEHKKTHIRLKHLPQIKKKYCPRILGKNINNTKLLCQEEIIVRMERGILR